MKYLLAGLTGVVVGAGTVVGTLYATHVLPQRHATVAVVQTQSQGATPTEGAASPPGLEQIKEACSTWVGSGNNYQAEREAAAAAAANAEWQPIYDDMQTELQAGFGATALSAQQRVVSECESLP